MSYLQEVLESGECPRCQERRGDIDEQYSFGVYAGVMCTACAIAGFRDQCGHGQAQGTAAEYEELEGPDTYEPDE